MDFCQACGAVAETRYVEFYRNIGLLIVRLTRSVQGRLCKRCVHKYFWEYTLVTAAAGWWGVISFILTPFLLLNNGIHYLGCLSMKPPAPYAEPARPWGGGTGPDRRPLGTAPVLSIILPPLFARGVERFQEVDMGRRRGTGRRKVGRKKRRMRSRIRHRK